MNPNDWYKKFLSDRALTMPTGKALYTYKIKRAEYFSLLDMLKTNHLSSVKWDCCFVLYAAEWWRNEYSGGAWAWEPIINEINKRSLSVVERARVVESGLSKWGRKINIDERGNDYIGTIVIECGLPLKVLESEHYLVDIITEIYRELGAISSIEFEYIEFVRSIARQRKLPETLQKDAFLFLLLEFVQALATFNDKYSVSSTETPTDLLNGLSADLREAFPLRMDNDAGKNFIERLLSGVRKLQEFRQSMIISTQRLINENNNWCLKTSINIKSGVHHISALGLTEAIFDNLSAKLEIYISSETEDRRIGFAFKSHEQHGFYVNGLEDVPLDNGWDCNWTLFFLDPKNCQKIGLKAINNDITSYSEPLIFSHQENNGRHCWQFVASGTAKLSGEKYRILVRETARLEKGSWAQIGSTSVGESGKMLYEIDSDCEISDEDNLYSISLLNEAGSFYYDFVHSGKTLDFFVDENKGVYVGWPKIVKFSTGGIFAGQIKAGVEYFAGGGKWEKATENACGRLKIRYVLGQKTIFCRWLNLLPSGFNIIFNPLGRSINLIGSEAFLLHVRCEIPSAIQTNAHGHVIVFSDERQLQLPTFFYIALQLKGSHYKPIEIKIPYPNQGIHFFDRLKQRLGHKAALYINDLHGVRLQVNNLSSISETCQLKLSLEGEYLRESISLTKTVKVPAFGNLDLPVIGFKDLMTAMFSVTTDIDSKIVLLCKDQAAVELRQFECDRNLVDKEYIYIDRRDEEPGPIIVHAFRLDNPFEESLRITLTHWPEKSGWRLPTDDGIWFIYPSAKSAKFFRPFCYKKIEDSSVQKRLIYKRLHQAAVLKREERLPALSEVLYRMASDFRHPDWLQLDVLFLEIQHLALSTLDVFTVLTTNDIAIIAAAVMLPVELVSHLSEDFCIIWFQFPVASWLETIRNYKTYLLSAHPAYAEQLIRTRLEWISDNLRLTSVRWIIEKEIFHTHLVTPNLPLETIMYMIDEKLNGNDQKTGLKSRHGNCRWPDRLTDQVVILYEKLPQDIRDLAPSDLASYQKAVAYLPFILAVVSVIPDATWFKEIDAFLKFKVTEIIDYDEDWFMEIYDLMQAYLWNKITPK